jgi:hypothetical protein
MVDSGGPRMTRRVRSGRIAVVVAVFSLAMLAALPPHLTNVSVPAPVATTPSPSNDSPVANFSASIDRLVDLLGVAGSGLLALVWARVALSWFSHDVTKKVQAKDRARDALIGTLLFVAALTGLVWGLAHWVLTGS